jgi:transcriptional regulator with PAS, ATPase and Fis domain
MILQRIERSKVSENGKIQISREKELIQKALDKHRGRRKYAAEELGISERTLYRKIKEYAIPG